MIGLAVAGAPLLQNDGHGTKLLRDEHGRTTVLQVRERVFDRGMGFRFEYPAHECLKLPAGARVRHSSDVKVVHNNLFRHEPSNVRHLRILRKAVETDEHRDSFRMWWLLAREEQPEKSVLIYRKVLSDFASRPGFSQPLHAKIWYELGQRLFSLKRWSEALEAFGRSISLYPLWREPFVAVRRVRDNRHKFPLQQRLLTFHAPCQRSFRATLIPPDARHNNRFAKNLPSAAYGAADPLDQAASFSRRYSTNRLLAIASRAPASNRW